MVTLHYQHSSMQFSDSRSDRRKAAEASFSHGAHFIGYTEVAEDGTKLILEQEARDAGYFYVDGPGDSGFAVQIDSDIKALKTGDVLVTPREPGRPKDGGHGPRHIFWLKTRFHGEVVFLHVGHWVTGFPKGGKRRRQHIDMTNAMAEVVSEHGEGRRLSIWSGDTNIDDAEYTKGYDDLLEDGQLTSVWDELGRHPNTFGDRTIDLIGTYDPDHRVELKRTRVWPPTPADHRFVSAWFNLRSDHRLQR